MKQRIYLHSSIVMLTLQLARMQQEYLRGRGNYGELNRTQNTLRSYQMEYSRLRGREAAV
jgi:hypothetical protein